MPTNEKEINNYLFDQLSIIENISDALENGGIEECRKMIDRQRKQVERKLYQDPPLTNKE